MKAIEVNPQYARPYQALAFYYEQIGDREKTEYYRKKISGLGIQ